MDRKYLSSALFGTLGQEQHGGLGSGSSGTYTLSVREAASSQSPGFCGSVCQRKKCTRSSEEEEKICKHCYVETE
ncbi:hypothetical protein GN956_G21466 [Arapaima gigas]